MTQRPSPTPIEKHLKTALEITENDAVKYHLREAYQKCIMSADSPAATE